jgi:hypothetical protein
MNNFEQYLVALLQGHITNDGNVVEVRRQFTNAPHLPVITLDTTGGINTEYRYHDTSGSTEKVYYRRQAHININVWCNTEEERENITGQVMECFHKEHNNHYLYCTRYNNGQCTSGGQCKAVTTHTGRTVKGKCPDPEQYGYKSISKRYGIVDGELILEPPFTMDEPDRHPPLLRSVISASCVYEECVRDYGESVEQAIIDDIEII